MSFPRYPEYTDSGVEWLGQIPAHWETAPLFAVARERKESNAGMREDNLLSLSYGEVVRKDINTNDGLLPESFETYQLIHRGDIVMRLTDLQNDKRSLRTALATERGIITSAYLALVPLNVSPAYLSYLLRAYDQQKVFYSMGGGLRQSMKFSDLKWLPIVIPEPQVQAAIATFLDHETGKIDVLTAEYERLIDLLKEKRQAVISLAVTKGLDPKVLRKDSGVEWLGEVPAHWGVTPMKYLVRLQSGGTPSKACLTYWDGEVPWASAKDMKVDRLSDTEDHITELAVNEGAASLVLDGAVIVVVRGMILARMFPVAITLCPMAINQDLKAVMCGQQLHPEFFAWYLRGTAEESLSRLDEAGHGTKALRMDAWVSLDVALPPLDEQEVIAKYIDVATQRFDALMAEAEKAIDLLNERRAALISAAVTGKIDVRSLVPVAASKEAA